MTELAPAPAGTAGSRLAVVDQDAGVCLCTASVAAVHRRLVAVRVSVPGGPLYEVPDRAGRYSAAVRGLLLDDTTGPALVESLGALGITPTAGATPSAVYLDILGPREVIHRGLRMLADRIGVAELSVPAGRAGAAAALFDVRRRANDSGTFAVDALRAARAAPDGPLARVPDGTVETLAGLRPAHARQALRAIAAAPVHVIVAGDTATGYREDLAGWVDDRPAVVAPPVVPRPVLRAAPERRCRLAPRRAGQAYLLWGTLRRLDGVADLIALELAVHQLAGWTGSRLWRVFREEQRYTYGLSVTVEPYHLDGELYALASVGMAVDADRVSDVGAALTDETGRFVAELRAAEIAAAATRLLRAEILYHDKTSGLMARTARLLVGGFPADLSEARSRVLLAVDPDEIRDRMVAVLDPTLITIADRSAP